MFQHYLEQQPQDFSFIVDQVWIYNIWFTTKFFGQIWWKKDLWVMFSNAKSMTCNLEMKSITAMQYPFKLSYKIIYLSNDFLVNCIQKGLRSNWLSDSAKNIAKNQKELTIRKRNWINSFNSSLSIPIPIPIPFIQFLCNSNSWNWNWNWNWHQFQFQFRNWPQPCQLTRLQTS